MTTRKKWSILVLIILCILVPAAFWYMNFNPVHALPKMDENTSLVVLGVETPEVWARRGTQLLGMAQKHMEEAVDPAIVQYMQKWTSQSQRLRKAACLFFEDQKKKEWRFIACAVLNTSTIKEMNEGLLSGDIRISNWDTNGRGKKGWKIKVSEELPDMYALLYSVFPSQVVLLAQDPQDLDRAIESVRSSKARIQWKNRNAASDYLIARIPSSPNKDAPMVTANLAWIEDSDSAHLQVNTDFLVKRYSGRFPAYIGGADLPLLGDGELAFVLGVDVPFLCRLLFSHSEDPIQEILQYVGYFTGIGQKEQNQIQTVLNTARLSVVGTLAPEEDPLLEKGALYLVLESKEKELLQDQVRKFAANFSPAEVKGWDWMYKRESERTPTFVLGGRGKVVLLGIARPESLSIKASIPDRLKEFSAPKDMLSLIALMDRKTTQDFLLPMSALFGIPSFGIEDIILDLTGAIHVRVFSPQKADIGFYWD